MDNPDTSLSLGEKFHAVGEAMREERVLTSPHKTLAAIAALGSLTCAFGTVNEALMGTIGGRVLEQTHNTLLTAGTVGGVSFSEQAVLGTVAALAVTSVPHMMSTIREQFFAQKVTGASAPGRRIVNALTFGATLRSLARGATDQQTLGESIRTVLADATIIGLGNAAIGAFASGVTNFGIQHGQEVLANDAIHVISNPLTWLAVIAIANRSTVWALAKETFTHIRRPEASTPPVEP